MKSVGLPLGISFAFWGLMALFRLFSVFVNWILAHFRKHKPHRYSASDIAVILPAHNEETVIRSSLQYLKKSVDAKQIYVVSDGSTDKTFRRARLEGCHVSNLMPGKGKARALVYLLDRYHLLERYKLIFIVDADTKIDPRFVPIALKYLDDPDTAVVFGSARIRWPQHIVPRWKYYIIAYRERLNRTLQYFLIYGMTWKYTNANFVVPGFATLYKSHILKQLEIDTPDLLIEDFNLAFQIHKKKLGWIAHSPLMYAWDQHPDNLPDYWKQVRRWNIGFYQTVKKNGIWLSFFWLAIGVFTIEVWLSSLFTLLLPFIFLYLIASRIYDFVPTLLSNPLIHFGFGPIRFFTLGELIIYVFLLDYIMTVIIGLINKKPQFIIYGPFFFFMHFVTSLIMINSLIPGFFGKSDGRWVSPKRRDE